MVAGTIPVALAWFASLLLTAAAPGSAQDTLRVDVGLVNIVATVTDSEGRYVQELRSEHFVIEDDGVVQEITHFSEDSSMPLSLGIALDTSGSMVQRMRTALDALGRFVNGLHANDEIVVSTFSDGVSFIDGATTERTDWSDALMRVDVAGGTALYDAIVATVRQVQNGEHDKQAVVVLTDGSDTLSDIGLSDALEVIRRSEVLVYALGIDTLQFADDSEHVQFDWPLTAIPGVPGLRAPSWTDDPVDLQVLESFASASGGKAFLVSGTWEDGSDDEINVVLDEVTAELRSQYTLGYYPSAAPDGRLHELSVRVRGVDYTVRARTTYRSPDPE